MSRYKAVIFDYDGVLGRDRFYANIRETHPEVYQFINTKIFSGKSDILAQWMRNKLTSVDVNKYIGDKTGIDYDLLYKKFIESAYNIKADERILKIALRLKRQGVKIAIVSDNMDVFTSMEVKNQSLGKVFSVIVNSADYGLLKKDDEGKLFDIAMQKIWNSRVDCDTYYKETLLIDNSQNKLEIFKEKRGKIFLYNSFEEFENWSRINLVE